MLLHLWWADLSISYLSPGTEARAFLPGMDFASFPSLTGEEFEETCHHLDSRYRRATLGNLRSRWKLQLRTALSSNFSFFDMPRTYIEITRILDPDQQDLGLDFDALAISGKANTDDRWLAADDAMMEDEASDEAALRKPVRTRDYGVVTYEIMLHPTYRMPCLYFHFEGLPDDESPFDLHTVFRRLVPDAYKEGLRAYGGVGGISIDVPA
ncbi:ubiquitin-like-conjugating enzyme ATG10 [Geosmithia morbida]|uniref:Ubiquitin-like-conjugating enzyme ATG10 n=1 Tax=Geosmithia morbida TaxID=1094350 RepID=A0A9P4YWP3_9HYPO|nr:ubiquitin-like-conjugating enzyme ATG10 [Geosmithia morbida]KAF4123430.1 ubiquitin-like-conjugating enzyme ATG10 [Geosmithia morbida]